MNLNNFYIETSDYTTQKDEYTISFQCLVETSPDDLTEVLTAIDKFIGCIKELSSEYMY